MKNFFTHNFNTFVKLPPLEHIFNSQGKIKILVELTKNEDLTITSLGKKVKLNHSNLKGHLNKLCDLNIVIEKRYGRIRIFQINNNSEGGRRIKEFIQFWIETYDE